MSFEIQTEEQKRPKSVKMLVVRKTKNKEKVENFVIINIIGCTRLIL